MDKLEMLEERLDSIQGLLGAWSERDEAALKADTLTDAKIMTLLSMVRDLADHSGVSREDFERHYEIRLRWWHDYRLQQIQDTDQATASRLDDRLLADVPTERGYPHLLETPSSE